MSCETTPPPVDAARVRQLRVEVGLGTEALARRARISRTTLHHIEKGRTPYPRAGTLHKLAGALGVQVAALLKDSSDALSDTSDRQSARALDRRTNSAVEQLREQRPELFNRFSEEEWDELYSEHGIGGALTAWGAAEAARRINRKRHTLRRLALVLETHLGQVAEAIVEALYESVRTPSAPPLVEGEEGASVSAGRL